MNRSSPARTTECEVLVVENFALFCVRFVRKKIQVKIANRKVIVIQSVTDSDSDDEYSSSSIRENIYNGVRLSSLVIRVLQI